MMEPSLPDELLLLALHDEKGTVIRAAAPALNGALVGAAMMELSLRGRLGEGAGRQIVADPTPTGDEILDDVSRRIAETEQRDDAATWVDRLTQELQDLKDRLLERMTAAGVLERRDRRILWVFSTTSFPPENDLPERHARDRIRAVVVKGERPDARTLALLSLVQACNLLDELFAPDEREAARRRIVELIAGRPAEGGELASDLGEGTLFELVGATLQYGYQRLCESFGGRVRYWRSGYDSDILDPWLNNLVDTGSSSVDDWPTSTWEERSAAGTAADATSAGCGPSDGGWSNGVWSSSPWADDSGSAGCGASGDDAGSSGWSWWWDSGSESGSSGGDSGGSWWNSGSDSDSSGSDSGSSWWDSGSSDSGSSDSSGWDSSSSDSSSSDSGSSD